MANGRGFGYAQPFDLSDPANWKYIYDYNYKVFYQTIPDANRFKIDGRPLIMIWTSSSTFVTNAEGNLSKALMYVRQQAQADFGINPYIVGNEDFIGNDSTCAAAGVLDATHKWFGPSYDSYTLSTDNKTRVGIAVAEFQHTGAGGFLDPNHGRLFNEDLANTTGSGAEVTLCEGFTDYEEDAAMFRVRNLDTSANPLTYDHTLYDYPNQRLNILRAHSYNPFPASLKYEAEGCDQFGGANGGNGLANYYRNGNIAIEKTSDTGGGWDVGWTQAGEYLEWESIALNGTPHAQVRIATQQAGLHMHVELDGTAQPTQTLPDTGGYQTWTTVDLGSLGSFTKSSHTVRFVFDDGNVNFNWWQTSGGTPVSQPPLPKNLALGKNTVVSSSVDAPNIGGSIATMSGNLPSPGSNAVDGDTSTEWHSGFTDNEWIYVDLGAPTAIAGVTLRWQVYYAAAYKIQISDDATIWTDEYSTTTGQGHVEQIPFTATTRYVRMLGVMRSQFYGYGLWEFEVNAP
jgi:hypothetical protein